MKAYQISDFSVLIGIDWADQKHDICELSPIDKKHKFSVISSKPESIHDWALTLKMKYPDKPIAVACELKKGPLIYALNKYKHIVIFPINPASVCKYRKAFAQSGAKNDPTDALIQAEMLEKHMDRFSPIVPECPSIRALGQLVEYRRKLVQDRVKLTNRIVGILKSYYPQVLDWYKEKDTIIFCNFVAKWPTLAQAKKARKQTLLNFFNEHNSRYPEVNETRIKAIKSALALTDDSGVIEPNAIMISALIPQLKLLLSAIDDMDKEIRHRYKEHEDKEIFNSLPGAGPQLAPRLLVAFGVNRDRYSSAAEIQRYVGVAPVLERSGKQSWVHWRYSAPTFLRQTFVEWAGQSIRFSFWAKAYYEQQMAKGKHHNTAIRSLAFKWVRIVFRCWKERKPYDESTYLASLKERNAPLLKYAVNG